MKAVSRFVIAVALLGAATLYADDAKSDVKTSAKGPPAKSKKTMTVVEMQSAQVAIGDQMKADYQHVLGLRDRARNQKDVIKLNCVNDRLVLLKAQLNIGDTAATSLQASLSSNSEERFGLYDQYAGVGENIRKLREEANGCIGEPELFKQEAGVVVTHPDIPDDPTTQDPFGVEVEPPGYASPFN